MKLGLFVQPSHPPERSPYDATQWDLEVIRDADKLGFEEAWVGEHFTMEWEPIPAPDLLIAQALKETKNIKLAPGAHVLPYHHPAELAHRVAYLDHLAQGRFLFGIGSGAVATDFSLFNIDAKAGQHRKMMAESLEIILKLWNEDGPWEYKGEFWTVKKPDTMYGGILGPHLYPFQKPHPPIAIGGLSKGSGTLKMAAEKGFIPMSFGFSPGVVESHWTAIEEGAKLGGKIPSRSEFRVSQDVFVADTDEEARELALNGMMGRHYEEYMIPLYKELGMLGVFKNPEDMPDEKVTKEHCVLTNGLVGSPDTVASKLDNLYEKVGGFGTLLIVSYDYSEQPEVWKKSMKLLAEEVIPRLKNNRKKQFKINQ